jgi:very-short-patch-repair endonuclease
MSMDMDVVVGEVAKAQHGAFTHEQAIVAGASEGRIKFRRRSGRWLRLRQGVYAIAGTPETYERKVMAMVLSAGDGAAASHLTAAALHEFPDVDRDTLEVSVLPGHQARVRGVALHRPGRLDANDVTRVGPIAVTSYARTLVDCTTRLSLGQIARALDAGLVARTVSLVAVERVIEGLAAGPNRRPSVIRMLLDERGDETRKGESRPENRIYRVLVAAGLPTPTQQHRVHVGEWFRLDLAYPDDKVAIEYDSWEFHKTRTAFDGDRKRDRLLQIAGWTILRFTSTSSDDEITRTIAEFVTFRSA